MLFLRSTSWEATPTPASPKAHPPRILIRRSLISYVATPTKIPHPNMKNATSLSIVVQAAAAADSTSFEGCQANLIQIALFFCLRSCEYTKTVSHQRTVQFRFKDLQFHDKHVIIPQDTPDYIFIFTKAVTLFLDTQKNFIQGESSTMETTGVLHGDPVLDVVCRYIHLWDNHTPPDTFICSYYLTPSSSPKTIRSRQIACL